MTLFYSFLKNYSTSASNIFREAFYCKFNVNLWTLCFVLQKVPKSFKQRFKMTPGHYHTPKT